MPRAKRQPEPWPRVPLKEEELPGIMAHLLRGAVRDPSLSGQIERAQWIEARNHGANEDLVLHTNWAVFNCLADVTADSPEATAALLLVADELDRLARVADRKAG